MGKPGTVKSRDKQRTRKNEGAILTVSAVDSEKEVRMGAQTSIRRL